MAYYISILQIDGSIQHETTDTAPEYERIKRGLNDGMLEFVPQFDMYGDKPCVAFCDEEGKIKALAANPRATYLWYACLAPEPFRPDTLHGTVYIIAADETAELKEL